MRSSARQRSSGTGTPAVAERLEGRRLMAVSAPVGLATNVVSTDMSALAVGNTLYFSLRTEAEGNELWKTDGTAAGTVMVKDILPGPGTSTILEMTNFGGRLFFAATDGQGGRALYRSDGTAAGTVPVARFRDGVSDLTVVGGRLFFAGNTTTHGVELYTTDGTTAGTAMVTDLSAGAANSQFNAMFDFNGTAYFMGYDADLGIGLELYRSDGTAAGTRLVKDIDPGPANGFPLNFKVAGGKLYFGASDPVGGFEPWTTDGTAAGTRRVKDIAPGSTDSGADPDEVIGNSLYVTTTIDGAPPALWKIDGPTGATTFVKNLSHANGDVAYLNQVNGKLVFFGRDATHGRELWTSDGTATGTKFFKEINPGAGDSMPAVGYEPPLTHNGYLFFAATDGSSGIEPWATDGTAAGTCRVADIAAGSGASHPELFRGTANGKMFFVTADPGSLGKLWVINVTPPASGTASLAGTVFNDADADRLRDTGEAGLSGWRVFIDADKDGVLDTGERTATTDAAGNYKFTALAAGTYRVAEVLNAGWRRTTPPGGYHDVSLAGGEAATGKVFGNTQKVLITGAIWNDTDGDAVRDAGEAALANWSVYLDADKDGVRDTGERSALTDATGKYTFDGLAAGSYRVRPVQQSGWRRTTSAAYYDLSLANGATSTNKNFAFTQRVLISGSVFNDLDGDRVRDAGEAGLSAWRVFIDTDGDGTLDTGERSVLSDSAGNWAFKDLLAGSYKVRVAQQTGWTRTTPTAGYHGVSLASGATATGRLFGERRTA